MKRIIVALLCISAGAIAFAGTARRWHTDPRMAAGEWKIEIQTPPCDNEKNLQVIWPKESGAPMTVECDLCRLRRSKSHGFR